MSLGYVCNPSSLRERDAAKKMPPALGALNIVCNLSNGWARRHGVGDIMTSWY